MFPQLTLDIGDFESPFDQMSSQPEHIEAETNSRNLEDDHYKSIFNENVYFT